MAVKKDSNCEGKLTFYLKNDMRNLVNFDMRNLVNFNLSNGKSEKLHLDEPFLKKACNVWVKKIHRSCFVKNDLKFPK